MLGSALCNSSNSKPDPTTNETYHPYWCHLEKWAIGAQYFFATFNCDDPTNHSSGCPFKSFAVTGDLIEVEPGETVYTRFERKTDKTNPLQEPVWILTMGVHGDRVPPSQVIADKPYMGLVGTTHSWGESSYDVTYPGSCWELYGMHQATDYPPFMHFHHELTANEPERFWRAWQMDEGNTTTSCRSVTMASTVTADNTRQTVEVNATIRF